MAELFNHLDVLIVAVFAIAGAAFIFWVNKH